MVITCNIAGCIVHNVLVDNGSTVDILTAAAFIKMGLDDKNFQPSTNPLCGFGGKKIDTLGKITLTITFGTGQNART